MFDVFEICKALASAEARRDAPQSVIAKFDRNVTFNMVEPLKACEMP